jgi:hypothetical protein
VALEHVLLAGDARLVDEGAADGHLEAGGGFVGSADGSVKDVAKRYSWDVVLTCLRDGEGEGCRHHGRESRVRPFPTCAYGQRRVCDLGRRCEGRRWKKTVGRKTWWWRLSGCSCC